MKLEQRFTHAQLVSIIDEAMIYMCACPAQVCKELMNLRNLFEYQAACIKKTEADVAVHRSIAEAVARSHALLEECLADILRIEKWDMETLKMPAGLRVLRDREIAGA